MDYKALTQEFATADRQARVAAPRPTDALGLPLRRRDTLRGAILRTILLVTATIAVMAAIACLPIAWYQRSLIYWASVTPIDEARLPSGTVLRRYDGGDRGTDYAAYVHQGDPDLPTVVYLHGRGEAFRLAQMNTATYVTREWTVVVPEYPGFSGLRGTPSEKSIGRLVELVHADLVARGVDPRRLVIHGNSLGAGPAMILAQHPHGFLLLTAPVARLSEVMRHWVPFVPTLLLRDRWDNVARAATRAPSPAVVIQAVDDDVVPIDQGRAMARATGAWMIQLPEGGHGIGWMGEGLRYTGKGRLEFRP